MNVISGYVSSPLMSVRNLVLLSCRLPYLKTIEQVSHEKTAMGIQGRRKLFMTGQAKLDPEHYSINAWATNNFTTADTLFYQLCYNVCYKSNRSKNHAATLLNT